MNFDQIIEALIKIASQNGTIKEEEIIKHFEKGSDDYVEAVNDLQSKGFEVIFPSNPDDEEDDLNDFNDEDFPKDLKVEEIEVEEIDVENFDSLPSSVKVDDPVRMYLKEIGKIPLLTFEEETRLARIITAGFKARVRLEEELDLDLETKALLEREVEECAKAKNKLVEANLRLVVSIAKNI